MTKYINPNPEGYKTEEDFRRLKRKVRVWQAISIIIAIHAFFFGVLLWMGMR